MKTVLFIADNAAAALARIHDELGPEAVVLSVRPLPAAGMARLWRRNRRIEIVAGVPDEELAADAAPIFGERAANFLSEDGADGLSTSADRWPSVAWLEAKGLLREHAEQLQSHLRLAHGPVPPPSLETEWQLVNAALSSFWRAAPPLDDGASPRPHAFIGPPGSGKTTVLCKWLTLAVLTEERLANVWRLDGSSANMAEFLTIHCEMLGAPIERFWSAPQTQADLLFVDLPGVEALDERAMEAMRRQLAALPSPRVHLVLNAAYETPVLLTQIRAFAGFEPEDLIFTHLDEESRRVKLWNFVFGTNCSLRFLSAGQKIPGEFRSAMPSLLFPSENRR